MLDELRVREKERGVEPDWVSVLFSGICSCERMLDYADALPAAMQEINAFQRAEALVGKRSSIATVICWYFAPHGHQLLRLLSPWIAQLLYQVSHHCDMSLEFMFST